MTDTLEKGRWFGARGQFWLVIVSLGGVVVLAGTTWLGLVEIAALRVQVDELGSTFRTVRKEISALGKEQSSFRSRLDHFETTGTTDLDRRLAAVFSSVEKTDQAVEDLAEQVGGLKDSLETQRNLTEKALALGQKLNQRQDSLKAEVDAQLQAATSRLAPMTEQVSELHSELERQKRTFLEFKDSMVDLTARFAKLQTDIKRLRDDRISELEQRLAMVQSAFEATDQDTAELRAGQKDLSSRIATIVVSGEKTDQAVTALERRIRVLQDAIKVGPDLAEKIAELEKSVFNTASEMADLRGQQPRLRSELTAMRDRLNQVRIFEIGERLSGALSSLELVHEQVTTVRQRQASLEAALQGRLAEISKRLARALSEGREPTEAIGPHIAALRAEIARLKQGTAIHPKAVIVYRVQRGDSLWSIAASLLGSPLRFDEIAIYNDLDPEFPLQPGQLLYIPVADKEAQEQS